jgi:hypothetical protein
MRQGLLIAAAVVGDDDRVRPVLQREPRVVRGHDALGKQFSLHLPAQPVEPRETLVRGLQGGDAGHVEPGKQRCLQPRVVGVIDVTGATVAAVREHCALQRLIEAMADARVERYDDGRAASALGALYERYGHFPVIGRIKLLPRRDAAST